MSSTTVPRANSNYQTSYVKILDGQPRKFKDICVHEFVMGDVEDPELYAAEPIYQWQQSAAGAWVMLHAVETPYWISSPDLNSCGYRIKIMACLSEANEIFWKLKWGNR